MSGRQQRPQPIRVISDSVAVDLQVACGSMLLQDVAHNVSNKQIATSQPLQQAEVPSLHPAPAVPGHIQRAATIPVRSSPQLGHNGVISPPSTPPSRSPSNSFSQHGPRTPVLKAVPDDICIDISEGELLGTGLWSNVYKVTAPTILSATLTPGDLLTPPTTPQKSTTTSVYAVKSASRPDAKEVFAEEARLLTHLSTSPASAQYIIPFHGLANSSSSLIFHCASTDLQTYASTTPLSTLLTTLPSIFTNLISGLAHMHSLSLIHADIKPANILLDLRGSLPPLARFADFSASFISSIPADTPISDPALPASPAVSAPPSRNNSQRKPGQSSLGAGGGTWGFMAPEQLSANPSINEPSYASDVYSLGITLLTTLMGGESPYREMEGQNVFLYREAIKMGDALGFVKRDAGLRRRLGEIEAEERGKRMVEGCKLALRKGKGERCTAVGWRVWALENLTV
ncbi:Protein kinase domain-containing protein 26 [Elsinoe fawcettii]|nr:Protein kinase domain-containing protein 26 [Elsinoe fawcettii]